MQIEIKYPQFHTLLDSDRKLPWYKKIELKFIISPRALIYRRGQAGKILNNKLYDGTSDFKITKNLGNILL